MKRIFAVLLSIVWGFVAVGSAGSQMRESDQASLLTGAVELARGEAPVAGNASYNYDKQYLSYWVVAAVLKLTGAVGEEATVAGVVARGNQSAALLFFLGLLLAVWMQREWTGAKLLVLTSVLLSPVVAFSGFLLSPNLFSGAFLLFLAAVLAKQDDWGVMGAKEGSLLFLLAFSATAARQDVILIMPLIALLVIRGGGLHELFRNGRVWVMVAGCLIAIGLGLMLSEVRTPLPKPFFVAPVFVAYLGCGLGASLLLVLTFAGGQVSRKSGWGVAVGLSVLIPLLFYGALLYTPRHLFLVTMALLATALLPQGGAFWAELSARRSGRWILSLVAVGTVVPWLVGVQMSERTKGVPTLTAPTLYPTADGFWPMGAYGSFFVRLRNAAEEPVDHNQELWAAWSELEGEDLPEGQAAIVSSGLASFGRFFLVWLDREEAGRREEAKFVLLDDRTFSKREVSVDRIRHSGKENAWALLEKDHVEVVARAKGRSILLWSPEPGGDGPDEALSLRLALTEAYGGSDFRVERLGEIPWRRRFGEGHLVYLVSRVEDPLGLAGLPLEGERQVLILRSAYDELPWKAMAISGREFEELVNGDTGDGDHLWLACGVLPRFMDIDGYGK